MANRATARMAKLVDAWDLKSPARKGVPVRFRLRAPSKIKGLRAKANANPCLFVLLKTAMERSQSLRVFSGVNLYTRR